MPYTLAMFFLWGMAMALVGGVVGWMLCRVRTRARVRRPPEPSGDPPSGNAAR